MWGTSLSKERYLPESTHKRLSTFFFQPSLPRLPVPKLQDTVRRYLAAQRPLLSDKEYAQTERLASEFAAEGSDGWKLHQRLLEKDKQNPQTSYVADFWKNYRYMSDRRPLPLFSSAYVGFKNDPRGPNQAARAANFIQSAVRLKNSVTDGVLDPDMRQSNNKNSTSAMLKSALKYIPQAYALQVASLTGVAVPLDMSQYYRVFGTTRVPGRGRDELVYAPASRHIVVMRNNHVYSVEVQREDGLPTDPHDLYSTLTAILHDPSPPPPHPVSILTATDRETWAHARNELLRDPQNATTLEKIESALFVVCLDHESNVTGIEGLNFHNYGLNRWFDKSLQLVVDPQAEMYINYEHTWGDSRTVVGVMNRLYSDTNCHPYIPPSDLNAIPALPVDKLEFSLTPDLRSTIEKVNHQVMKNCRAFLSKRSNYPSYGKLLLKNKGISPNGVIQFAFQMAYHRQHGALGPSIYPCTTETFLHGRTEWVHPGTMAAKECIEAFQPCSGASSAKKMELLKTAVHHFSKLCRNAEKGQGFDRHMYALKILAEENGHTPSLFEDPAYLKMNHIQLYPSCTVPSDVLSFAAVCPFSLDGLAVVYGMKDDSIDLFTQAHSARSANEFCSALETVLNEIKIVLQHT